MPASSRACFTVVGEVSVEATAPEFVSTFRPACPDSFFRLRLIYRTLFTDEFHSVRSCACSVWKRRRLTHKAHATRAGHRRNSLQGQPA